MVYLFACLASHSINCVGLCTWAWRGSDKLSSTWKVLKSGLGPGKSWKVTWRVLENKWLWVEMQMYSNEKRSDTLGKQ